MAIIKGTWTWDFEDGGSQDKAATDFHWGIQDATLRYIAPTNGAGWTLVKNKTFQSIDKAFLQSLKYSESKIKSVGRETLAIGTVLACRTAEGNFVKVMVSGYDSYKGRKRTYENYMLKLSYVLYE